MEVTSIFSVATILQHPVTPRLIKTAIPYGYPVWLSLFGSKMKRVASYIETISVDLKFGEVCFIAIWSILLEVPLYVALEKKKPKHVLSTEVHNASEMSDLNMTSSRIHFIEHSTFCETDY